MLHFVCTDLSRKLKSLVRLHFFLQKSDSEISLTQDCRCKVSVELGRKVCERSVASVFHLFTLPCTENQKNEGREGQREEMERVSGFL